MLLLVGAGVYLYLRPTSNATADNAATVGIQSVAVDAQRGSADFAPALDGDIVSSGDLVRSNKDGRAVLTFFDGSTVSVDPGALVKVLTLNRLPSGGIEVLLEQTLGRSWAAVAKLKPDSKFEIKTPSSIAAVRGTAFETNVTQNPDGTASVIYKVDDGTVLVTANAGGSVTVGAGQQVTINSNQPASAAATPQPPTTRLLVTPSAGLGVVMVGPTGTGCGNVPGAQAMFGCVATGNTVTLREPPAGRYVVVLTAPGATQRLANATLTIEAFRGGSRESSQTLTRTLAPADIVRTGFSYANGQPQALSVFDPPLVVPSICEALTPGRVFATDELSDRYAQLRTFAAGNKAQPVALVVTDAELTRAMSSSVPSGVPATLSDVRATIDLAGVHLSARADASILTLNAATDISAGPVDGKLVIRIRSLSASPLPAGLLDPIRSVLERSFDDFSNGFPFVVRQVAMRQGCLSVMGTTP